LRTGAAATLSNYLSLKPRSLPAPVFGPTMYNRIPPERPSTLRGREPQKAQPVAAMHYRKRSDSFQSRHKAGTANRRGGNGELQIEGARRGAGTRQDARANSASHSSAHFVNSQGVDPRSLNWKISSPGKARDRSPAPKPCTTPGRQLCAFKFGTVLAVCPNNLPS
jgi:hypothetical protein